MSNTADVLDREELDMLESTTRQAFAADVVLGDLGELGLIGLLTPEDAGGDGWRVVEACVVARECGRALSPVPWIGATLGAAALAATDAGSVRLSDVLAGTATIAITRDNTLAVGDDDVVSGRAFALGAREPDFLVVPHRSRLVVVGGDRLGVAESEDNLDTTRDVTMVTAPNVPGRRVPDGAGRRLHSALTLLTCADSVGALAGSVELVTDYLIGRDAFGRPLASFQVMAHRLADLAVLIEAAQALVDTAAVSLAAGKPGADQHVAAAHAYLARRCVTALDDCIQLSGGIGFTWEWPLHQAMRRVVVNAALHPVDIDAGTLLSGLTLDVDTADELDGYRRRVREVISAHRPYVAREGHRAPESPEQERALRDWYRKLYDAGFLGASWPAEWGGRADWEPRQDLILTEELIRGRAPRPIDQVGLASHVLLHFGTEEQKRRHLPPIREGRDIWCQLFSEPGAGSDLAGITARARCRDDGSWVLAGQKTWTTDGHWAQYGLALLRTSVGASRHDGITAFIVPMGSEGLVVKPKATIGGAYEFNDVFLDGVVLGPGQVVGEVGGGWSVAMSGLDIERFTVGANVVLLELLLADLLTLAGHIDDDGARLLDRRDIAAQITDLVSQFAAAKSFLDTHLRRALENRLGEAEPPIAKILYSETYNRIARFGVELATAHQPLPPDAVEAARRLQDAWLWSRALTISGGSSEVMRNIIAKRRLRLPSTQ
ncbi:acyl-CoA dehydrogenase family protein [Gordonia rhizosphera]|uniref:Putative acyl-CoA dehydrogenase n=1 Tax=Gordonia rhizosphera NBRC 16068 TaxID=1108045 RepID=K6WSM1_9ACTN|nr:acyl-CoA dehydrogenase family protein [Gordonia rhizosphera]GAB89564.1 putative acyl-CoA dehydrogenase [Gordonia rhizosphera NBRC 16068]